MTDDMNDPLMFDPTDPEYDGAGGGGGAVLPDGKHIVFVGNIDTGRSSQKGTPYVEVMFECHDPTSPHCGKRLRWQKYWLSKAAMKRYAQFCRAANPGAGRHNAMDVDVLCDLFLERSLVITVQRSVETYNGVERERVEARFADPLKDAQVAALKAKWGEADAGIYVPAEGFDSAGLGAANGADEKRIEAGHYTDDEVPF